MAQNIYTKKRVAEADRKLDSDQGGVYHKPLLDNLDQWNRARASSTSEMQNGFEGSKQKDAVATGSHGQGLGVAVRKLTGVPHLDSARFLDNCSIAELALTGSLIDQKSQSGAVLERKRGKIQNIDQGLKYNDGSSLSLDLSLQEYLAKRIFDVEAAHNQRANLIYVDELGFKPSQAVQCWEDMKPQQKGRYYQAAYELSLALHYLQRANPAEYQSIIESSNTLGRITRGEVKPYLTGLSKAFIDDFCIRQHEVAYTWRSMLAPSGSASNPPVFSKAHKAFTNQMGIGTLEFLLTSGRDVLDYLRNFGTEMNLHPYRRTEIKDEHASEIMPGVPLQGGKFLMVSPEAILHIAREHHELWRFSRELSWLMPDKEMHWPPRKEHVPFKELPIPTKNKDMIAAFGVAYMLGSMPVDKYNTLRNAAAEGNPLSFPLSKFEVSSDIY